MLKRVAFLITCRRMFCLRIGLLKKHCNITPESASTSLKRLKLKVNGLFPVILIHGIVVIITN